MLTQHFESASQQVPNVCTGSELHKDLQESSFPKSQELIGSTAVFQVVHCYRYVLLCPCILICVSPLANEAEYLSDGKLTI